MSLEQVLADNTAALNANTAALKALNAGPAPAAEPTKTKKEKPAVTPTPAAETPAAPAVPTVDDLRKAATAYIDLCLERGQDANDNEAQTLIKAINTRQGTKSLSKDTPEANRAAVIAELKAATEALRAKPVNTSSI